MKFPCQVKSTLLVLATGLGVGLPGCMSVGPSELNHTQVDYARALGEAKKRQILAAIVGLRFADAPAFLTASQIIVGYDFSVDGGPTVNTRPSSPGAILQASGTLGISYASHPTFTFTPATGEAYAHFIRPLPPTLILPLANSQIPIDLILRVTAQSIGGLQNSALLAEAAQENGSPDFFDLLATFRRLQLAGAIAIQYREVNKAGEVFLSLAANVPDPAVEADIAHVRKLLDLPKQPGPYQILYGDGNGRNDPATIRLSTRSVLGILGSLGEEVLVSPEDIADGSTKPTTGLVGLESRSTIIVHSGKKAPADAYVTITYRDRQYWIERTDFDSKYALTLVQDLMALAESGETVVNPVLTIPAS